jgi:hypothetical protein
MATGDASDLSGRIKALLPTRWFADSNPIRDAVISGFAVALALVYSLLQYTQLQTRIGTATDGFLDLISFDYFSDNLPRRQQEQDNPFRSRILATLLREKVTRTGMIEALVNLTGRTPIIFEPARPADTGGWNIAWGWDTAGGWGALDLRAQVFIKAFRPEGSGIPNAAGWDTSYGAWGGGYSQWTDLSQVQGAVTDLDIYETIAAVKPEGVTAWTQLQN